MKIKSMPVAATALALALAGCGPNDEAAENQQNISGLESNSMMADPNNPFAGAMQQMMDQMMAAVGSNVGQNWARKMIVHHQGAIDMSQVVLGQNPTPDVATVAQETIDKQAKEIAQIRALLEEGPPDQQSAALYWPAMMEMHQRMMAAAGANISETFLRKMAEHHRGAVAMSDIALANGVSGAMRDRVQATRAAQLKEIETIEAMLQDQSHQEAMQATGATSEAEPAPAERTAAPAKAAPRRAQEAAEPRPEAPATAEPKAEAEAPETPCAPEHREAGHC